MAHSERHSESKSQSDNDGPSESKVAGTQQYWSPWRAGPVLLSELPAKNITDLGVFGLSRITDWRVGSSGRVGL